MMAAGKTERRSGRMAPLTDEGRPTGDPPPTPLPTATPARRQSKMAVVPQLDDSDYPRVSINTRLRYDVKKRLAKASQDRKMSIQSIIETAVIAYLDELEDG